MVRVSNESVRARAALLIPDSYSLSHVKIRREKVSVWTRREWFKVGKIAQYSPSSNLSQPCST